MITMRKTAGATIVIVILGLHAVSSGLDIGATWRYVTTDPGRGWNSPNAKETQGWKTGRAGFGRTDAGDQRVQTEWRSSNIWMRGKYVMPAGTDVNTLSLNIRHNEDAEVYINGALAARLSGYVRNYRVYPISDNAKKTLKEGDNVIAVHCRQTVGGQFIDVGLTTKKPPVQPKRKRRPEPRPPVKTPYARKTTWAKTMLAIRKATHASRPLPEMDYGSAVATELWRDFPHQTDWLMQDSQGKMSQWVAGYRDGKGDITNFLQARRDASLERMLIAKVLPECGASAADIKKQLDALSADSVGPDDQRWLDLYVRACRLRRRERLGGLLDKTKEVIFARHHNLGNFFFAYTEYVTWPDNVFGGLFRLDLAPEASHTEPLSVAKPLISTASGGIIRDPALSYDAKRLLFAWRQAGKKDQYYKVHEMELATGKTRIIAGGDETYGANYDPAYLGDGNILFNSTRIIQIVDCAGPDVSNFFVCDKDGRYPRRVGFDQVHTLGPSVLDDGRIVYLRWDYNDRSQIYTQALMQMNPDGTGQTEYYGNNTFTPTTFFHPRGIPGTSKVLVALGGHHNPQCGKLGIIDNSKGRQGTDGVIELPSGKKPTYPKADKYAQVGDQYSHPYPLDDSSLLVSYDPIGYHMRGRGMRFDNKKAMRFHLYFMTFDGKRELLSADSRISSFKPIPVMVRKTPLVRPSVVDYGKNTGVFYLQDIYTGPGLKGVHRGTIKKLRVVELKYREMNIGRNQSAGKGGGTNVVTPIAVGTGAWDVKVILGDVAVHADGSAMFEVPARTPVYFQALNAKNQVVQTMRSWATLMPGERFSCVGCHENKNETPGAAASVAMAMKAGPEKLTGFHGPKRGFSFPKEIQPILNKHCVSCHNPKGPKKARDFLLTDEPMLDKNAKRFWSRAYLTLTGTTLKSPGTFNHGKANDLVNWINNSSEPTMIPPRYGGSTRSKLIAMLETGQMPKDRAKLSRMEMDKMCAWIDMVVPFCGDYTEANAWSEGELANARERLKMRKQADLHDTASIEAMLKANK